MSINPEKLKALRQAEGWTKQHLADASDISLRKDQRVEQSGNAGAETMLCLAAALNTTAEFLHGPLSDRPEWGQGHMATMLIMSACILFGTAVGAMLTLYFLD